MVPDITPKGHSFHGAFAYYLHDKGKKTSERVGWTETLNLMTDDPHEAKRIMIATALQADALKQAAGIKTSGRKSNQHVYAYSLAWHPDEADALDKGEMMAAVEASLNVLQAEHLQAVVVCHTDQKHPHVHVVLNRVDPSDGRMHSFKNDRLQLSDWANEYERERGQILTPAREETRKKREQNKDKKARQDYAKRKRDEASARSKDELSPAAMLKDLSQSQKERHRQEWSELSADNKAKRNAIYDKYRKKIQDAVALHKQETKPFWREHFKSERDRKRAYNKREANLLGVIQNAIDATSQQYVLGELEGRNKLSAHFSNVLSSQKRRAIFEKSLDMDRQSLRSELKTVLDGEVRSIQSQRKQALKNQRAAFDRSRSELIKMQDTEWQKVNEAWKQLRRRSYRHYQRSSDSVKEDFDNSRRPNETKPKPQPTRTATVSTPSPAPTPSGEVPRVTAKQKTVPKAKTKDWTKSSTTTTEKGLARTEPAKKDWSKTGASKPKVEKPKDWGKKVAKSDKPRKPPAPRHDLDRSR